MAYDEALAERVRELLAPEGPPDERRMFGGLAFLVDGSMAVAAVGGGALMVRVDPDDAPALLALEHVEPMTMGERETKGWVLVGAAGLESDEDLAAWVARGVARARSL